MKISMITVCYNSAKTIEDTLKSVLSQTYKDYEYIIVDGKSKDNTLDIIKRYEKKFKGKLKYISEKDKGLYDAMNKGIKMASGDIIGIINSDDVIASSNVFELVIKTFKKNKCDGVYSNLLIKDENLDKVVRTFKSGRGNYKKGFYPPHPTLYLKKNVYDDLGYFDLQYRIAADYDFMLRVMKNDKKLEFVDEYFTYMRAGGTSTDGLKSYYKSFKESYNVLKHNNIKYPLMVNINRTLKVLLQTIKK